jgi:hypothetical protein
MERLSEEAGSVEDFLPIPWHSTVEILRAFTEEHFKGPLLLAVYPASGESAALACVVGFCRTTPVWSTK